MDSKLLKDSFRAWKKAAGADYAITYTDSFGDCQSCVNSALADKYGVESKGIFLKHWRHGMNGGERIEALNIVYVAHDITEEQAKSFYAVFGEHYKVFPKKYNPIRCFSLVKKDKPVYLCSAVEVWNGNEYQREEVITNFDSAIRLIKSWNENKSYKDVRMDCV